MAKKTVLIIKHGFSEVCDQGLSTVVSYGDVFRCTCLLEEFRDCRVTWISAPAARDLLEQNHLIDQLILADRTDQIRPNDLLDRYDIVINLEKQPDWCRFAARLAAGRRYGFSDEIIEGEAGFYPDSARALSLALQRDGYRTLQETLFQTVGRQWRGQRYVLGYRPKVAEIYDIGLNHHVGPKWPTKRWPKAYWQQLHDRLSRDRYALSWQQSLHSIRHYIDWLASCRLIVTCDSLGLHLGLALRKQVVALFGPTAPEQIHMYGLGIKLTPACQRDCLPCFGSHCLGVDSCMEHLTVDMVHEAVGMLLDRQPGQKPVAAPPIETPLTAAAF
ncbi:MAG: hypothetical protein JW810_01185 [Sedimentisphaerales bacterium]|nr:hypothetical protein [Sedimentisphaerales bacterium]